MPRHFTYQCPEGKGERKGEGKENVYTPYFI